MRKDLLKKRAKLDMQTDPVSSDSEIEEKVDNENGDPLLAADPFDSLMSSNTESPPAKKTNGVKKAPSPVKDILTSDDEKNDASDVKSNDDLDTSKVSKDDDDDAEKEEEEEDGFEVEDIVGHKWIDGEKHYRIRWKNYGKKDDTWQLESDLSWQVVYKIESRLKIS